MNPSFPSLFGDDEDAALIAAYVRAGRTLDDLPYTSEFDALYDAIGGEEGTRSKREVFHKLHNLRKANKLPRLGRAATPAIKVTPEEETLLRTLMERAIDAKVRGKALAASAAGEPTAGLGARDQLLYDPLFIDAVTEFSARTGRNVSLHDAWRLLAKIAK